MVDCLREWLGFINSILGVNDGSKNQRFTDEADRVQGISNVKPSNGFGVRKVLRSPVKVAPFLWDVKRFVFPASRE